MHICAHQISSWLFFKGRHLRWAEHSPSREGRKVKSLCAGFWSDFFIVYFQLESQSFSYETTYCGFKGISLVKASSPDSREGHNCKVLCASLKNDFFYFHLCDMTLYQNDSKLHLHKGLDVKCHPCPLTAVKYFQKLHFFTSFKKRDQITRYSGKKVTSIN